MVGLNIDVPLLSLSLSFYFILQIVGLFDVGRALGLVV